jgi:hypothetical protein
MFEKGGQWCNGVGSIGVCYVTMGFFWLEGGVLVLKVGVITFITYILFYGIVSFCIVN